MSIALRSTIAIALTCIVNSANVSAQQLRQPASVLPWVPPTVSEKQFSAPQANPVGQNIGHLLGESTFAKSQTVASKQAAPTATWVAKPLPMVEMESFALLGPIRFSDIRRDNIGPTTGPATIDPSTGVTDSIPSARFFRASRDLTNGRAARR